MTYLIENCPSAMFLFTYTCSASDKTNGQKMVKPIIERCKYFAEAFHIHFHADEPTLNDDEYNIRLVFNIKEPQNLIFIKVSALFSFAQICKIDLINQFYFTEDDAQIRKIT